MSKIPTSLKYVFIGYETLLLVLAGYAFLSVPNEKVFQTVTQFLHLRVTSDMFGVACLACAVLSLFLPRVRPQFQWRLYLACSTPIIGYLLPVAYYIAVTGGSGAAVIYYGFLYVAIVIFAVILFWMGKASNDTAAASAVASR